MPAIARRRPWLSRLLLATPILRRLVPVQAPQEHVAGSDYMSTGPLGAAPAFSVPRSMSAMAAFPWVTACVEAIYTDLAGLPLVASADGRRLDAHPALDLLTRPSERTSGRSFRQQWAVDYLLAGWGPRLILSGSDGLPRSLVRLHPSRTTIKATPAGEPDYYAYAGAGSSPRAYAFSDVLCPRRPSWEDDPASVYGQGAIRALNDTLTADLAFQKLNAQAARHGRPAALIKPAPTADAAATRWNPTQAREIKDAVAKMSRESHGGFAVLNGLLDLVPIGWSPRDMEAPEQARLSRETTLASFGVPPSRVGLPTANYATQRQQMRTYWEGLRGIAAAFDDELSRLASRWTPGVQVRHDFSGVDALQTSRTERLDRVQRHIFAGLPPAAAYRAEGFADLAEQVEPAIGGDAARALALDMLGEPGPVSDRERRDILDLLAPGEVDAPARRAPGSRSPLLWLVAE